jgi:hypothetical protein
MRSSKQRLLLLKVLIAVVVFAALAAPGFAQSRGTPEQTVKEFYRWYMHELNANSDPRKQKSKISSTVSARLRKWFLTKEYKEWDADYFIDAQDFDPKWENGVSASNAVVNGNKADVKVTLGASGRPTGGMAPQTLRIKMVKEDGIWKIDRVNGH